MNMIKRICVGLTFALALTGVAGNAYAQKEIKIGVIYDYTGPLAAGGSLAGAMGTKAAIDMINERGGVEGYKIHPIYADAQSKPDIAINEMTRLIDQEHVDLILGVFSSAECVPMAQLADSKKKIMWATICVASSVVKNKNLEHFFRVQVHSDQYGETSCQFLNSVSKSKLGKDPKDLRVAIIHEDGPYGSGIASSNESNCKALGMKVVLKEGYSATAPDLSTLVTKLRRARADVILHTGYNPDITLFWRQAREQGLKWKALIGHGAGYAQYDKLHSAFGKDVEYLFDVDPVAAQLLDPKTLKPGLGDVIKEMEKRYIAQVKDHKVTEIPAHVSMGFNHTYVFLTDVLPRAIKKYGGISTEALRKAALDTDIPVGGTIQGYGVKFFPPGTPLSGQNERSSMVVMQYVKGQAKIVYPTAIKTADPVIPLPKGHTYAAQ